MKSVPSFPLRAAIFACILLAIAWAIYARLSNAMNLIILIGGPLLVFPHILVGRWILDRHPEPDWAAWATTYVHTGIGFLLVIPIVRAIVTHQQWAGPVIPMPAGAGLVLVILTGVAALVTVVNLALKGLGAPFFISLSRKLATDWTYAWTRNPMVLAVFAFFLSLGLWFQSTFFVLWTLMLFVPAMLFFIKVYEERELEIRFGASYLEYKSKTPMLFPRKPTV